MLQNVKVLRSHQSPFRFTVMRLKSGEESGIWLQFQKAHPQTPIYFNFFIIMFASVWFKSLISWLISLT